MQNNENPLMSTLQATVEWCEENKRAENYKKLLVIDMVVSVVKVLFIVRHRQQLL